MAQMVSGHLTGLGGRTERERRRGGRPAGPPAAITIAPRGGAASGLPPSAPAPPTPRVECGGDPAAGGRAAAADPADATGAAEPVTATPPWPPPPPPDVWAADGGWASPDGLAVAPLAAAKSTAALLGPSQAYLGAMEWSGTATSRAPGGGGGAGGSVMAT